MSAMDVSGLLILGAGLLIAASELLLTALLWSLPTWEDDPCRERPSALPTERQR